MMKRTYVDILGEVYDDLEDDLELCENTLKKLIKTRKRPVEHKIRH
ncbi:MAG: hypothetical protein K8I00_06370 [Candidatus Omnitrophica bacterium]|nr:hypothetical protein [Candidatus Omnitrophota bacterium]